MLWVLVIVSIGVRGGGGTVETREAFGAAGIVALNVVLGENYGCWMTAKHGFCDVVHGKMWKKKFGRCFGWEGHLFSESDIGFT